MLSNQEVAAHWWSKLLALSSRCFVATPTSAAPPTNPCRCLFVPFLFLAQFVAPFGAYEALLGTNPIAVGIPREEGKAPVVLDMATAAFPCECHRTTADWLAWVYVFVFFVA